MSEIGTKCIRLVKQLLAEEEILLMELQERGSSTTLSEFNIARMKYALGEISERPNCRDYFPSQGAKKL